jgi:lipid A disaccharide synthetase
VFIQQAATPEDIAATALDLLRDEARRRSIKAKLARVIESLGEPGANKRAAAAILALLGERAA